MLRSIPAHLWAPEKAGVRQPILIFSPLNPLEQKYHLPCPPPLLQYFLPLHLHLQVINAMRRPFQAIYVGVRSPPPPPSSWPPNPPTRPCPPPTPTLKVARKREGVGVWPIAAPPRDGGMDANGRHSTFFQIVRNAPKHRLPEVTLVSCVFIVHPWRGEWG